MFSSNVYMKYNIKHYIVGFRDIQKIITQKMLFSVPGYTLSKVTDQNNMFVNCQGHPVKVLDFKQ